MGTNFFERLEALNAKKSELQKEYFVDTAAADPAIIHNSTHN